MVELPEPPAIGVVASFAFLAKALFMMIVFLMTGEALLLGILERVTGMAFLTGHHGMLSYEGECGDVMVEKDLFCPAFLVMAPVALFMLLFLVDIVFLVAGNTLFAWLFLLHRSLMALMTFRL